MEIAFNDGYLRIVVSSEIYNIEVLHKCFYWYGNDFAVEIEKVTNDHFLIVLKSKNDPIVESNIVFLSNKIKNDLVDFKLRDIVTKETTNIRDLLIAKAFSNYELSENPTSKVSDPVGFTPQ